MASTSLRESPLQFVTSLQHGSEEREQDTLNLLPYAEALRDFIHDCETPMTIGIQGDWGIGKTSLMNMLRGNPGDRSGLLKSTRCKVVNFETWSYAQFNHEEHLAVACLYALTAKVGEAIAASQETPDPTLLDRVGKAKKRLGNVIKNLKVTVAGVSVDMAEALKDEKQPSIEYDDISEQLIAFREDFSEIVRLWVNDNSKRRVVIFIDDLDRIRPIRALELLEALKNFVEVPGCVFILAVDYEVVQTGMVEKFGRDLQKSSGKSFFDKIIQLPFVMPTHSYKLDEYIMSLLADVGFPYILKLQKEPESRAFFEEVTLCTVGRNPRSIKRVMTYANLLERIRKKHADNTTSAKDSKILYALICMQIAWPELFAHFTEEPTVETISNLENWDYLEHLPEARKMFDRSPDSEKVKNDISTFFDTLFDLLDENDDGRIDSHELAPVLDVMALVKMTSAEIKERPRDFFVKKARENSRGRHEDVDWFLSKVFTRSNWYLGADVKYRKSGNRAITAVCNRRQIGTLVTLKRRPLVFRLAISVDRLSAAFGPEWFETRNIDRPETGFIRGLLDQEASLTGFGDTIVDFPALRALKDIDAVDYLNRLLETILNTRVV